MSICEHWTWMVGWLVDYWATCCRHCVVAVSIVVVVAAAAAVSAWLLSSSTYWHYAQEWINIQIYIHPYPPTNLKWQSCTIIHTYMYVRTYVHWYEYMHKDVGMYVGLYHALSLWFVLFLLPFYIYIFCFPIEHSVIHTETYIHTLSVLIALTYELVVASLCSVLHFYLADMALLFVVVFLPCCCWCYCCCAWATQREFLG